MTISRYQTYTGTIQPGELFTINRAGRSVTCFEASAGLEIVIDDGSSSAFFAGVSVDFDYEFKRIQLLNPNDTPVTFQVATAMGKVNDNRLTASGILRVADPDSGASFSAVRAAAVDVANAVGELSKRANEAMQGSNMFMLYAPKHKIGTSFMYVQGVGSSPVTLIDPAVNTSGVIIRTVVANNGAGNGASIFAGPSAPASWVDATKRQIYSFYSSYTQCYNHCDPIHLPAGDGLYFLGNQGGSASLSVTWDYL
ncbi:hypothetical protein [Thalassospira marina]|uniref:Uncharacterized protein n=1 Tax=Thalassospira marina TaxID=2048283 RepID=A0A2N3KTJ1_9PROT|nr:hypothetical protein [Thalassospira marina]AUG55730.1 hypothetical protein CSC3H3_23060 [Thalassospira marina]PKR53875.1 hypothetical protein COO20_12780 [Thalassospira marina]